MTLTLFTGTANPRLAAMMAERLETRLGDCAVECFPDGELHVAVNESVRGHDVYLVQPTGPPVERHLLELVFLADACRRAGAARITGVVPYFGYARQERRASGREAVGARVVADLLGTRTFARIVAVDLHAPALEGFFAAPLEHLSAIPVLIDALREERRSNGVVVAPDVGAASLAERYAKALHLPLAVVLKARQSGSAVEVRGLTGDVSHRVPLIVDDMISTGATVAAAAHALLAAGSEPEVTVVATHGLFVGRALERLAALRPHRVIVTDSVAPPDPGPLPLKVATIAPLLAEAVSRLHHDRSLADLLARD